MKYIPVLFALVAAALGPAPARAQLPLLYVEIDGAGRSLKTAVPAASVAAELTPLIERKLNESGDIADAKVVLRVDSGQSGGIGIVSDVTAKYRFLPALDQWTDIECRLGAVLRLTSPRVGDARIELANPNGIAKRCAVRGAFANALGGVGQDALTALVNAQLGTTPWSQSVRVLLDSEEARQKAYQFFAMTHIPDDTRLRLTACQVGGAGAICAEIDLP